MIYSPLTFAHFHNLKGTDPFMCFVLQTSLISHIHVGIALWYLCQEFSKTPVMLNPGLTERLPQVTRTETLA